MATAVAAPLVLGGRLTKAQNQSVATGNQISGFAIQKQVAASALKSAVAAITVPGQLHKEIIAIAGQKPAIAFSNAAIRELVLNGFSRAVKSLQGLAVPLGQLGAHAKLHATFQSISVTTDKLTTTLIEWNGFTYVSVGPTFEAVILLHGDSVNDEFSLITYEVAQAQFTIATKGQQLLFKDADYFVEAKTRALPGRAAALAATNLTETEVLRAEGGLELLASRILDSVMGSLSAIELNDVFPAIRLKGTLGLHVVGNGLVVVPSDGVTIQPSDQCPIRDSLPDLNLPVQRPSPDKFVIVAPSFPVAKTAKTTDKKDGFAAVYMPPTLLKSGFGEPMPGFSFDARDNGFIGWWATCSVGVSEFAVSVDKKRLCLVLNSQLKIAISGALDVDVPCKGRQSIGTILVEPTALDIQVAVFFEPSDKSILIVRSEMERMSDMQINPIVAAFGPWLSLVGGKAGVVGFVLDFCMARIISAQLPYEIRQAVRKNVNSLNFRLGDFAAFLSATPSQGFNRSTFSGESDSLLVGMVYDG